jgi:hypothetical protein
VSAHEAWRAEVIDAALGLLREDRRAEVAGHLEDCAECREEHDGVRRALAAATIDPAARREPPVEAAVLLARVQVEVDRRRAVARRVRRVVGYGLPLAAAAALALLLRPPRVAAPAEPSVPVEVVQRMERTVNREQTVRYLQDAQGVLVSVTTALPRCERVTGRREAGPEARRSRDLLARRRLLVDDEADHLAAARPVLEDVDHLLARVAALDPCAPRQEVEEIARVMTAERLLMKIDLLARELAG